MKKLTKYTIAVALIITLGIKTSCNERTQNTSSVTDANSRIFNHCEYTDEAEIVGLNGGKYISVPDGMIIAGPMQYENVDDIPFIYLDIEHDVEIIVPAGLFIQTTEVTQDQFLTFVKSSGYAWQSTEIYVQDNNTHIDGDLPVTGVSINDAEAYCQWLTSISNCYHRLPTEYEWEYVCKYGMNIGVKDATKPPNIVWQGWTSDNRSL